MTTVTYINVDGSSKIVEARPGDSIMLLAISNGINGIVAECGGNMMCATCHVYIGENCVSSLTPVTDVESEILDGTASERRSTSRLGCQVIVPDDLDNIDVYLPEHQL